MPVAALLCLLSLLATSAAKCISPDTAGDASIALTAGGAISESAASTKVSSAETEHDGSRAAGEDDDGDASSRTLSEM